MNKLKIKLQSWLGFMHKKVVLPMRRQHKNPSYLARSNAIGMSLAFAPFPGQVPVVVALWMLARRFKWRFSLGISLAWTFISNVFTNLPLFYLYYLTGNLMRGSRQTLQYTDMQNVFSQGLTDAVHFLATEFGMSILLGSFVYMLFGGIFGYCLGRWTARFNT